jgi:hypothetical protein
MEESTYKEAIIRVIAAFAHEANRAYCESMGDTSQPEWKNAPDWQKDSAVMGVNAVLNNQDTTPKQSHEGWYKQKEQDGWVYGETKDPEKKTHPCMVPYSELPQSQQIKDYIFLSVVKSQLRMNGLL